MSNLLKDPKGIAVTATVFVISVLIAVLITGSLLFSSYDLKLTSNLKVSDATLQVADAAIHHALSPSVIEPGLAFDYTAKTQLFGPSPVSYDGLPGYSYSVSAVNASPATRAILTATAWGPNNAKKVVRAYVRRGGYGFGAVHIPGVASVIETGFSGATFTISGKDKCGKASSVPGISTTDPATVTEITNDTTADGGLAANQMANVTGAGGAPSVIDVKPSMAVSDLAVEYINQMNANRYGAQDGDAVLPTGQNYAGNQSWGTFDKKRTTLITPPPGQPPSRTTISGTIEGYGVLIVDGPLYITGTFNFNGLVIVRGDIEVHVLGNAGIRGSLLLAESADLDPELEFDIRGNASVQFDSCALLAADAWVPLPQGAQLVAWQEVM